MKNLKKVLALVLVVATLMSFATVASAQFTDDNSIEKTEAVEVLSSINVINGYTDGSFRPDGNVTRAQMAKMVAYIVAGGEDVGNLYAAANTFSDCTTHWAKGYIAYANKTGIVAGVGGGKFNPDGSVTGTQAAKMMLCALGYDAAAEGYTGTNWAVNTLSDARDAGLLEGLENVNMGVALSRENAAQLMFNALKADMVKYDRGNITIESGDTNVIIGGSNAEKVANTTAKDYRNTGKDEVMQLCEKYFPDLKLTAGTSDVFGRPADKWAYEKEDIGTYTVEADATYSTKVKVKDIYADLGLGKSITATMITNGVEGSSVSISRTGNTEIGAVGQQLEVYYDVDNASATICAVDTYVGEVSTVVTADDVKAGEDPYIEITDLTSGNGGKFETSVAYAEDDVVLYTYAAGEIQSVAKAEVVEDVELTSKTGATKFVADGKTYEYNTTATTPYAGNVGDSVTIYLDQNGYAVYVKQYEAAGSVAYVLDYKSETAWTNSTATYTAKLLLLDGTIVEAYTDDANPSTLRNKFVSYTVDDDNVYTLSAKDFTGNYTALKLEKGVSKFDISDISNANNGIRYANSATVFLVHDTDTNEYTVYTGIANVPSMTAASGVTVSVNAKDNGTKTVAKYVYISAGSEVVSAADSGLIYIVNDANASLVEDKDLGNYYSYDAVIDGEITTVKVASNQKLSNDVVASKLVYNSKGVMTGYTPYESNPAADKYVFGGNGTGKAENGTVKLGTEYYTYAQDVEVFKIDSDLTKVGIGSIKNDTDDSYKAVIANGEIIAIFVTVNDSDAEALLSAAQNAIDSTAVQNVVAGSSVIDSLTMSGSTVTMNVTGYVNNTGIVNAITAEMGAAASDIKTVSCNNGIAGSDAVTVLGNIKSAMKTTLETAGAKGAFNYTITVTMNDNSTQVYKLVVNYDIPQA